MHSFPGQRNDPGGEFEEVNMELQIGKALPWFLAAIVILGIYIFLKSRKTGKK